MSPITRLIVECINECVSTLTLDISNKKNVAVFCDILSQLKNIFPDLDGRHEYSKTYVIEGNSTTSISEYFRMRVAGEKVVNLVPDFSSLFMMLSFEFDDRDEDTKNESNYLLIHEAGLTLKNSIDNYIFSGLSPAYVIGAASYYATWLWKPNEIHQAYFQCLFEIGDTNPEKMHNWKNYKRIIEHAEERGALKSCNAWVAIYFWIRGVVGNKKIPQVTI